jgi:hypothetical protein
MHCHTTSSNFTQRAHKGLNNPNLLQQDLTDVLRADLQFHTLNRATPSQNLRPLLTLWHMPTVLKNLQSTPLIAPVWMLSAESFGQAIWI